MKTLIFITLFTAALSTISQAQAQYYRGYYRPAPRVYRPYAYRPLAPYRYYNHRPAYVNYRQVVNYNVNSYYHNLVTQGMRNYFYGSWFMVPTNVVPSVRPGFNGYVNYNQYPYFAYNGYLHRYSNIDNCNYQLVNKIGHVSIQNWVGVRCNVAYNQCAQMRDGLNYRARGYQFFCAETFRQGL